jgi:2-polyprenyl-3-methyl-5-hydroxy-6-metoxy-1,4-benzoquinol methylase
VKCRACNSSNLFDAILLGNIPVAGGFIKNIEQDYPLVETNMLVCSDCGIGQTSIDLDPKDLFVEYNWRTSTSSSYVKYAKNYCKDIVDRYSIKSGDWVLEIASNDGYMLKNFKEYGIDVLGIDPAKNIAFYAIADGIPTITDFFGSEFAYKILKQKGYPKLIIANNVMAHVPNIQDFMNGISILCSEDTVVSIENPTIMNILQKDHFDTIFHEHYSYLSANGVDKLSKKYGLTLFDLEKVDVHGGSNRYWLSNSKKQKESVINIIDEEINAGLFKSLEWQKTFGRIKESINNFKVRVDDINNMGGIVCGYTASAKSTVLLNFAGIKPGQIKSVADDVVEKQNHYIPGSLIPIVDINSMLLDNPTDIIVFSWNIYEDIKKKIIDAGYPNINVWVWNG